MKKAILFWKNAEFYSSKEQYFLKSIFFNLQSVDPEKNIGIKNTTSTDC